MCPSGWVMGKGAKHQSASRETWQNGSGLKIHHFHLLSVKFYPKMKSLWRLHRLSSSCQRGFPHTPPQLSINCSLLEVATHLSFFHVKDNYSDFSQQDQLQIYLWMADVNCLWQQNRNGCLMSAGLSEVGPFWGPQRSWEKVEESRRLKWLQLPPRKLTAVRLVVNEVRRGEWHVGSNSWANQSITLVRGTELGQPLGGGGWKTPDCCQKQHNHTVTSQLLFPLTHLERRDKEYVTKTEGWLTPGPPRARSQPRKRTVWYADVCKKEMREKGKMTFKVTEQEGEEGVLGF